RMTEEEFEAILNYDPSLRAFRSSPMRETLEPMSVAPSVFGFPIVIDDRLEPDDWYLDGINYWHPAKAIEEGCARAGIDVIDKGELPGSPDWDEPLKAWDEDDLKHPSKETGQFVSVIPIDSPLVPPSPSTLLRQERVKE